MPFLINNPAAQFDPIPLLTYYKWRDVFLSRNLNFNSNNGNEDIDLSEEDLFINFNAKQIHDLIKNLNDTYYLTVHFTCQGASRKFKKLKAIINVMKKCNCSPTSEFIGDIDSSYGEDPNLLKNNYKDRKNKFDDINNNDFNHDEEGISHQITDKVKNFFADDSGTKKIKIIFVKIPMYENTMIGKTRLSGSRKGRLTVVFADESFDPYQTLTVEEMKGLSYEPFDFSSGCCPPAYDE
ncbi:hypothetical protein [Runella sp.]|uniref:hypothetical protein n=1 Tax=Runella sp. TaxID=1960881 RepID=UPI003D0E9131